MELKHNFFVGMVEDNKDPNRKGRIKVRVQTLYHDLKIEDIPYAYPFAGLAGKEYQIPAIGKLVNVVFLNDDLYSPYYIFSENYNVNLKNKLKDLSEEEYVNFVAILFDERTNIFADSKELTIDHLFNKATINDESINLELKDNNKRLNLGSKGAEQDAVLGTNYFEWMDKFIKELLKPFSLTGNMGAPILRPALNKLCIEYKTIRSLPKRYGKGGFVSKNVKISENTKIPKLERTPKTIYKKDDFDLTTIEENTNDQCQEEVRINNILTTSQQEKINDKNLREKIEKENKKACEEGKTSQPNPIVEIDDSEEMMLPIIGSRISSKFGLRKDPTNPTKTEGHNGVDIPSNPSDTIVSPSSGKVIGSAYKNKGGNYIKIRHDNGIVTGYAHLNTRSVNIGDKVTKGQKIGEVGNTGWHTTGPHLHFTVTTPAGDKVDPEKYFKWPYREDKRINKNKFKGQEYNPPLALNECEDDEIASENDLNISGNPLISDSEDVGPEECDANFKDITKLVIENMEGGYYNPKMMQDGRLKYDPRYNKSGETMFGIDRKTGGASLNQSPAGKQFWSIIDKANEEKPWPWLYKGGKYEDKLMDLCADMMKPRFEDYANRYLDDDTKKIVMCDKKLLFNVVYATWNGSGFFKYYSEILNKEVMRGNTDPSYLNDIVLNERVTSDHSLIVDSGKKIKNTYNKFSEFFG